MEKSRSEIFQLCDEYFDKSLEYDPVEATYANKHHLNDQWGDYSFFEKDPFMPLVKRYRKKISEAEPIDYADEIAQKVILVDLDRYIDNENDFYFYSDFGSVYSHPQGIYEVFEIMPKVTRKDILNIAKRMEKIPNIFTEWITSLQDAQKRGIVNAKIRVDFLIDILENYSKGMFLKIAMDIDPEEDRLVKAARGADVACEQLSAWLEVKYKPVAVCDWFVGRERYLKNVKEYTGLDVDPEEIYAWGLRDLALIREQMWEVADQLGTFTSLIDVRDFLNSSPKYTIEGKENFKAFLEGVIKEAIANLKADVFTIPVALRNCQVELDEKTIDESPYYKSPSDDMDRAGKTVYPTLGRETFSVWENYSTWFHESIPGHHMQIGTAILNKEKLTRYQRENAWNSGYGEGWALYSEFLMDELGYFSDPGYKMGYLLCQALRLSRLVVDIGLHLQYQDPNGEEWTMDSAVKFMEENALLTHRYAISEVKRYISWSGQAISYKLGEKVWIDSREEAKARLGEKFNLKKFHTYALKLGPMGLDILQEELRKWKG